VKNKMQKTKIILAITALSLVIVVIVGVAFAQYVNAQPLGANSYNTQTPSGYNGACRNLPPTAFNGTNAYPTSQGTYPYGPSGIGMGMGMGMHGRFW
jgi:hypothetical protein